jgi:type II secretion system protein G
MRRGNGFTLIELLIVVGIISILAMIALPNMLEAQVRSKVSRARSDMRTVALALETYSVDTNHYPPNRDHHGTLVTPERLSTPTAYLSSLPHDPFRPTDDEPYSRYDYHNVKERVDAGTPNWPPNDLKRYGVWRLASYGPSRQYQPWMPYDPTNGSVSEGNVIRTQMSPDGSIPFTYWDPANPTI